MTPLHFDRTLLKAPRALLVAILACLAPGELTSQEVSDTYTWSAELMAVDERAGTITARSRLVTEADAQAVAALPAGTNATLVWSGMSWAAGVRRVTRAAPSEDDVLTLPVEIVGLAGDTRHLTFKVAVPKADIAKVRSLVEGGWITAESPRRPSSDSPAVVRVRPYNDGG